MPEFAVTTPSARYPVLVTRGAVLKLAEFFPARSGRAFIVTTEDVWRLHAERIERGMAGHAAHRIIFPGGEHNKRLAVIEHMAEEMMAHGGDRSSFVIAFGGGIVNDLGGFLAAVFLRGVPVIQVPTTLLAQVDAAVGGKTAVNLVSGKNLVGAFHQPRAVLIDPEVLRTLPQREYRAGLFEVIKCGIIRSASLFHLLETKSHDVLAMEPDTLEEVIAESVRIKCEVVSEDEKESDLRRILNFGHTIGHALEAETRYTHFLHGEAVALGMKAATELARLLGMLDAGESRRIRTMIDAYGPVPGLNGVTPESLLPRLAKDKKTIQGSVHFVLPTRVGEVRVVSGIEDRLVLEAMRSAWF